MEQGDVMTKKEKKQKLNMEKTTGRRPVSNRRDDTVHTNAHRRKKSSARRRKARQRRMLLLGLAFGLCVCILLFSVWKLASILLGYQSGESEYKSLRKYVTEAPADPKTVLADAASSEDEEGDGSDVAAPMTRIDLASLQGINSDAVGWIEIPDTSVSYPLVHTTDNTYYLTHTFDNKTNRSGSIFVEASNAADFSDLHTIIYGHNMKNGSMFAGLKNYSDQSYAEAHPYIYVDLADGSHCYEIFSAHEADATDITYTIGYRANDTYASFLDSLKTASLYDTGVEVTKDDSVISLSTCTKSGEKRFVVHAKKLY